MDTITTTVEAVGTALVSTRREDGTMAPQQRRPPLKPQPRNRFRLYWDPRRRILLRTR